MKIITNAMFDPIFQRRLGIEAISSSALQASAYMERYGLSEEDFARVSVKNHGNAGNNPCAHLPMELTIDDVMNSEKLSDPIKRLDCSPVSDGAAAIIIAREGAAGKARKRPVWIKGFGEHISFKTLTYADDPLVTPIARAAARAFEMAGLGPAEVDIASVYDCYTITVLMTLEDAGFCPKGQGMNWIKDRDLTFRGDFPLNTAGGQLGFGQAGLAGGMHHVCDAARQIMGRAGDAQVADCNRAFVSGNGGILSEQTTLILQGD